VVFVGGDLFRKDDLTPVRDQYLQWWEIRDKNLVSTSAWDRHLAALRALDALRNEEIGSISLEMTYIFLLYQFRQLKISKEIMSSKKDRLYEAILELLFPEWDNMKEIFRRRHRNRLTGQMKIGRRWSFVVDRLSHGIVFLAGKKISTIMWVKVVISRLEYGRQAKTFISHRHDVPWKNLESLLAHITENYPRALSNYNEADVFHERNHQCFLCVRVLLYFWKNNWCIMLRCLTLLISYGCILKSLRGREESRCNSEIDK
jgi:hypothetical protein